MSHISRSMTRRRNWSSSVIATPRTTANRPAAIAAR